MVYTAIKKKSTWQYVQLIAIVLLPWGLYFSEAMASILMGLFFFPVLFYGHSINWEVLATRFWPFFVIYALLFIGGFRSSDTWNWISLLRANLPYIVFPIGFALWPCFLQKRLTWFFRHFILASTALSLYLLYIALVEPEMMFSGLREGGSFETPVHHVRTSLFLAIGGVLAWHEWSQTIPRSRYFWLVGLGLLFIIAGLHILAVRTGIILFYMGTVATFLWNTKFHHLQGYWIMFGFGVVIAASLIWVPTIREKWQYFLEDIANMKSYSWWFYSDAVRWESNVIGWEIFLQHPWWGVGMGDLGDAMHMQFFTQHGIRIWQYPHNLWITFLSGSGLVGFVILNLALGKLYFQVQRNSILVFRILFVMFLVSCLVENTLLTSLGSAIFVLFALLATSTAEDGDPPVREQI